MFRTIPLALLALAVLTGAAEAKTKLVELRVEGDNQTLEKGTWYATGRAAVKRARRPNCQARPKTTTYTGASALTALARGQAFNPDLKPIRIRPTDFGPQVCRIGDLRSFGTYPEPNAGFLYAVNYASGFSSADLAKVANGDSVLWYYAVFPSDPPPSDPPLVNEGCVLELSGVPAQDDDGDIDVQVAATGFPPYCDDDVSSGVAFAGADSVTPSGAGEYTLELPPGTTEIYAHRPEDVRSNRFQVCVGAAADCPAAHGRTIVGSRRADRLPGTAGFDRIRAGAGKDRVNLRRGGADRVSCGPGDDVVLLRRGDGDDRVRRSCERIRRS